MASLTKEVNWRLAKRPLVFNGRLANRGLTSLTHLPLDKMAANLTDNILKRIFLNKNIRIAIQFSLRFVPTGPVDNIPALV